MPNKDDYEILIVGGGPSGLSAGLVLGRCHRKTLICDDGHQRNLSSGAVHGLLGFDGQPPLAYLRAARQGLERYSSVSLLDERVTEIVPEGDSFAFSCADGTAGRASRVLLATGMVDELPAIRGVEAFYGKSVHHCLYCDGFEYAGKPLAAYGKGDKGASLALMMKHWVSDIVVCSDGTPVSPAMMDKLVKHGIPLRTERVEGLDGRDGQISKIVFQTGADLPRAGLFFSTGCRQASDLSDRLGCRRKENGGVVVDPQTEETSVPGAYVAGDVSRDVLLVAVAVAEGAKAAVAINKALLRREGLCE